MACRLFLLRCGDLLEIYCCNCFCWRSCCCCCWYFLIGGNWKKSRPRWAQKSNRYIHNHISKAIQAWVKIFHIGALTLKFSSSLDSELLWLRCSPLIISLSSGNFFVTGRTFFLSIFLLLPRLGPAPAPPGYWLFAAWPPLVAPYLFL